MRNTFAFFCIVTGALAAPAKRLFTPSVTIKNGTVTGSTTGTIDTFNGIPFAQPPVGNLRLKPPQSLASGFAGGSYAAVGVPTACPQFLTQVNTTNVPQDAVGYLLDSPIGQTATLTGENCLTLNVLRPSTATSSSKLPVVVWIYGGGKSSQLTYRFKLETHSAKGFEFGSTQTYNGSPLVQTSMNLGQPVIYVEMNYRLSGFGFLAGKEVKADGSTNLGLRDQRLALQWVAENIAAFGGDPDKVLIAFQRHSKHVLTKPTRSPSGVNPQVPSLYTTRPSSTVATTHTTARPCFEVPL